MAVERTGEAFEFDERLAVVGRKLAPGEQAPDFALDHWDGSAMQTVRLADTAGQVRLLQRGVIVIGKDDTVTYAEYVNDQMLEPDYDAAVAAAQAAVGS
jgi:peroxiredoxin